MKLKLALSVISISLILFLTAYGGVPETRLLFSIGQNTIRLGVINSSKQNLDLEIVSKTGNIFLSKTTKGGTNFFQMFDVSNLPDGEYVVHLFNSGLDIKKQFVVENRKPKLKIIIEPKFGLVVSEDASALSALRAPRANPPDSTKASLTFVAMFMRSSTPWSTRPLRMIVPPCRVSILPMRGSTTEYITSAASTQRAIIAG